jgi:uncharacterized membrane protein
MQVFSIQRTMVTLGAVAALAVGTGIIPNMTNHTPTAQAAELAQHGGGHGGSNNMSGGHNGGGNNNGGHNGGGNNNGGHNGGGNNNGGHMGGGHNGGGHNSFGGHRFHASNSFSHSHWGWGFHRSYPQYYVTYYYEPVSVCENYYFDDDDGAWYCFVGY